MRTTLDLPDDLFRLAKARAALQGISLKQLITSYVESGLAGAVERRDRQRERSLLPVVETPPTPAFSNTELYELLENDSTDQRSQISDGSVGVDRAEPGEPDGD